jgi:hypothetical protein
MLFVPNHSALAQSTQDAAASQQTNGSLVLQSTSQDPNRNRAALRNNLYCAGYIQNASVDTRLEIIGGEEEQDQYIYSQGDYIYINGGANAGMREGELFTVTRPRGGFRSPFSRKGKLGIYVQEVGTVRIVRVKPQVSVALVENSCDNFLLGDLLVPRQTRFAPVRSQKELQPLDRFVEPNGKATGRIVLARDGLETLSRDQIVYLDLGAEDNVKSGDYLTIYRPLGGGNVAKVNEREIVRPEDPGFESTVFRGGKFGNQAPRRRGSNADREIARTPEIKERRPKGLRKIVGEVLIISVQQRSATAVITRNAQEIHTGDYVELQ